MGSVRIVFICYVFACLIMAIDMQRVALVRAVAAAASTTTTTTPLTKSIHEIHKLISKTELDGMLAFFLLDSRAYQINHSVSHFATYVHL